MDNILDALSNPFLWGTAMFIAGVMVKAKLNSYLKIISVLIDAVEIYDAEIKDILTDEQIKKLKSMKVFIAEKVGVSKDRAVLDKMLENKGYLAQGIQQGGTK